MVNTGIEVISSGPSAVPPKELKQRFRLMSQESAAFRGILTSFNEVLLPSVMPMFKSLRPVVKQQPPDIMVIDICALAGVMLAEEYNVPFVLNNPSLLFSPGESSALIPAWGSGFGTPILCNPAWSRCNTTQHRASVRPQLSSNLCDFAVCSGTSMTLVDRLVNVVFPRLLSLALIPPFMHLNKVWLRSRVVMLVRKGLHGALSWAADTLGAGAGHVPQPARADQECADSD
jgi:hypothetical protein